MLANFFIGKELAGGTGYYEMPPAKFYARVVATSFSSSSIWDRVTGSRSCCNSSFLHAKHVL